MLDPVAVRSYLGSLGQQGGGQGGGGVQALLANLRNRLYGPQAQGGMNETPGINPNAGGGPFMPNKPNVRPPAGPAEKPAMGGNPQIFQAEPGQPQKPAWQQLRDAGMQGTGSAAGNRAAAAGLGGQPQITSFPMPVAGQSGPMGAGMPPGSDMGFQSGGPFMSEPLPMGPAVLNGLTGFPGGGGFQDGDPVGVPTYQSGGGLMPPAQLPPAVRQRLAQGVAQGAAGPGAQPPGPAYGDDGVMAQLPGNRAKPTASAGPPASPAVLGTQQFQGPNARRINAARQGIFNNVRQALRRPAATGGKVGG